MVNKESEFGKIYNVLSYDLGLNLQLPKKSDNYSYTSIETRKKIGDIHRNKVVSIETRIKLSEKGKNRIFSEESKRKMSESAKNMSQETKDKISKACKGLKQSKEHIEKRMKLINQYDLKGNFIKEWLGATTISKELNISADNITSCCRDKSKTAGGFIWKYKSPN